MNKRVALCLVATVSVLLGACRAPVAVTPKNLAQDEAACYAFVKNNMLRDGGMITNYHKKAYDADLATGSEVLSESQGLLLLYTANIADRDVFDDVYRFTRTHLDNGKIFAYRYNPTDAENAVFSMNAAVDDLRIIKALFTAGDVFSDKTLTKAAKDYTDRFYLSNVEDGRLYDFYDAALSMKNSFITLCYLDLEALDIMAQSNKRYDAVYENALHVLQGGYISDDFPLFMTKYDYAQARYEAPNGINLVEAVLTALNLAYADKCPPATITFLKKQLDKGHLYTAYDLNGTAQNKLESTAVYALCALLAKEVGDEDMYQKSISCMKKMMVTQRSNALYGAFGDERNVYSFDNLMALTAFRKGAET